MQICQDLADGRLDGNYSQQDLAAYQDALQHDPTIQGYCSPLVVVTPPTTTVTTTTPGTTTTVTTGTTATTTPAGTTTVAVAATPPPPPPPTTTTGVAGTTTTKAATPPPPQTTTSGVAGAQKTKTPPPSRNVAPATTTRRSGTLPFTGAELGIFALVGAALVAAGVLLRLTGRRQRGGTGTQ